MSSARLYNHTAAVVTALLAILLTYSLTSGQSSLCDNKLCLSGNCTTNGSSEICVCPPDYTDCIIEVPANCSNVTGYCLNNSTCLVDSTGDVTCQCMAGYTGERCELAFCDNAYCSNQGVCTADDNGTKTCECQACYDTGPTCAKIVDMCSDDLMTKECHVNNTAACLTTCSNNLPQQVCNCKDGFIGDQCSIDKDECKGFIRCSNHGLCVNSVGSYYCECDNGWQGADCSEDVDECSTGTDGCEKNTEGCFNMEGTYRCNCTGGYTEQNCTTPSCGDPNLCSGHGSCSINATHWLCACEQFYSGVQCEIAGPCANNPCVHGSCNETMNNGTVEHICTCDPGWTNSSTCNDNINECDTMSPCQNGGICIDTEGSYTCNCTQYWTGAVCGIDVEECLNSPCGPGSCVEENGNYSCNCLGTGFEGQHCEVNLDECGSSPCQNNATCVDNPGSYTCSCISGWDGRHCEKRDWCSDNCVLKNTVNGNSCTNLADRANCTCDQGYLGSKCAIMDPCLTNPCENGKCVRADLSVLNTTGATSLYSCECTAGYTGENCESPVADPNLAVYISVPIVLVFALAIIIGGVVCFVMARKKRATRGRYSPSRNEILGPNLQMSGMLKPPPEERLI